MIKNERGLYKPIQNWLHKQGYIVDDTWINTGGDKYRVDVVGVRNSGNKFYDDVEIVAVEAKMWGNVKALGQTENYKDFAHKVYFATADETIADGLKEYCTRKKLGLLVIDRKTKRVNEVLGGQVDKPNESQMIEFLRKIWVARCTLCGCYFDFGLERKQTVTLRRWTKFSKRKSKIRKYLCSKCIESVKVF